MDRGVVNKKRGYSGRLALEVRSKRREERSNEALRICAFSACCLRVSSFRSSLT